MQGKTISELSSINNIDEAGLFPYYYNGQTFRLTYAQMLAKIVSDINFSALDDIGQVFISDRTDAPKGCLNYCNGVEYTNIDVLYPEFFNHLVEGTIYSISYEQYDIYLNTSISKGPSSNSGWCPFIAFNKQARKMKMPKMDQDQIAFFCSNNRTVMYDGLPDIAGTAELKGVHGIETGNGLISSSGNASINSGGNTISTLYSQTLSFKASGERKQNNIYGRNSFVSPKAKVSVAYIVVSNQRYITTSATASVGDLTEEIIERKSEDLRLLNRIMSLEKQMGVTGNAVYYNSTYYEMTQFVEAYKPTFKVGNQFICGGLDSGEKLRTFLWSGTNLVEIENTIDLVGYVTTEYLNEALANKVDKIAGYGLSKNDYTDVDKAKIDNMVAKPDLDAVKTELESEIEKKIDSDIIKQTMDLDNPSDENLITEEAIASNLVQGLSKKMDKSTTFSKVLNLEDAKINQDWTNLYFDLKTLNQKNNSVISPNKPMKIIFEDQIDSNNRTVKQQIYYDNETNSLTYTYSINSIPKQEQIIRNGVITTTHIVGGRYWLPDPNDDALETNNLIINNVSSEYDFTLTKQQTDTADFQYSFYSEFLNFFENVNEDEKITILNNKITTFTNSFMQSYNTVINTVSQDATIICSTKAELIELLEQEKNLSLNDVIYYEKVYKKYQNAIAKVTNDETSDPIINLQRIENGNPEYTYNTLEEFNSYFNTLTTEEKLLFDGKIVSIDSILYELLVSLPTTYYTIEIVSGQNYYLIELNTNVIRPTCNLGTYSEITTQEIIERLNALENVYTTGDNVLMNKISENIYQIQTVTINNGGSNYEIGDRIRIEFDGIKAKDYPGYLVISNVGENGTVTEIIIGEKGYYFTDLSDTNISTHNKDNIQGVGLTVDVVFEQIETTLLKDYVPLAFNVLSNVKFDEEHNYQTCEYVWKKNNLGIAEWHFIRIIEREERDFFVEPIDLKNETTNYLPKEKGGFGQDVSNIIDNNGEKKIIGANGYGNVIKIEPDKQTIEIDENNKLQLKEGNNTTDGIQFKHLNKKLILNEITENDFYYCFYREYIEEEETKVEYVYTKSLEETAQNVYSINDKTITLLGQQGTIINDILAYNGNNYDRYNTNDNYYIDKSDKRISNGDLSLDLFKLIKSIPSQIEYYKQVSSFNNLEGNTKTLYYLNTSYSTYTKGFYEYNNTSFVKLIHNSEVDDITIEENANEKLQLKEGNSTDGIQFKHLNTNLILDNITENDYYYCFYREYIEEEEIKTEYVYTKSLVSNVNVYSINNKEIILLGTGTVESEILTYNENIYNRYNLNDDYYIDKSDKRLSNGDLSLTLFKMIKNLPPQIEYYKEVNSFDGIEGNENTLYYLNTTYSTYKKGFYGYSELNNFYILVGDSDVFIDVNDTLPITDIDNQKIYRLKEYEYIYDNEPIEEPQGYQSNNESTTITSTGIIIEQEGEEPIEYTFTELTDSIIETLIENENIITTDYVNSQFFKINTDLYIYKTAITRNDVYILYHNPTATSEGYLLIGGGSGDVDIDNITITKNTQKQLQANSILDVIELPGSNIKENVIYRIVEATPIRMVKLFQYNNNNWINLSIVNISFADYSLLTETQKNDGTIYIVDGLSSELIQWTYNNLSDKPKINSVNVVGNLSLEDLSLYSRTEIDTMMAGKGTAEFVNSVPSTTVALTWYYSKKFIDNTDVPNDKRALYIADKLNVLNYMGVVGDVDLSNYYMKSEVDTLLATKIDTAGDGLSKTGTTLKINNSITANTINGLKSFSVDKNGLVTAYTTKSLGRGLNESSNVIGHSNSITVPTAKRIIQGTYDAQGHLTAIENEFNWSNTYNTSAENQLFTRKGANNMYVNYLTSTNGTLTKKSVVTNDYSHYIKCGNVYQLSIGFQNTSDIAKDAVLYTLPATISSASIEMYIVISTINGDTRVLQCGGSYGGGNLCAKSIIPAGYWFGCATFIKV